MTCAFDRATGTYRLPNGRECRGDDHLCTQTDLPREQCAHCTGATNNLPPNIEHPWTFNGQHAGKVIWSGKDPIDRPEADMPARQQPSKPTTPCHWDDSTERHMLQTHQVACKDRDCTGCVPCERDEHGTPVTHCRFRRRCTSHLTLGDHTCPRCLSLIRSDLTLIVTLAALADQEAIAAGPDSDALSIAGPAANVVVSRWRRINAAKTGEPIEETDWAHPAIALAEWERTVREDLEHDTETVASDTLSASAGYLDWVLTDLARDVARATLLAELGSGVAQIRAHLEGVMHDSRGAERGAPCPTCPITEEQPIAPRLTRHWNEADKTGADDTWRCPRDPEHWWYEADYRKWVSDDYLLNATWLSAPDIERTHGIKASTLRQWASRDRIARKKTTAGRWVYNVDQALALNDTSATA